jgi:hypothetical protein
MAKANKEEVVAPVVVHAAVVQATSNGGLRGVWQGYTTCALLRALGYAGYTAKQATALLPQVGLAGTSASTVGCQVGAGRQYARGVAKVHHPGSFTPLPAALLAHITTLVGAPALPHATVAALPAPRVPGAVVAPPAPVPPPVAPVAPSKPAKGRKAK